jgi:Protein of unknown function (DUF2800)
MGDDGAVVSGTHAVLSYSKADRWTRCTGSIAACRDIKDLPSEAAELGTAKHQVQHWALSHSDPLKTITKELNSAIEATEAGFAFVIDDEFREHVNTCLGWIRAIPGDLRLYELPLKSTKYLGLEGQGGTADVVIGDREKRILHVGDSKFGYGEVLPEGNRQCMGYARSALEELDEFGVDYDEVWLWIFQPKRHKKPLCAKMTVQALRDATDRWALPAQVAMKSYLGLIPPIFTPGDVQCQWCPIRANCKARNDAILNAYPLETGKVSDNVFTDEDLSHALDRADFLEAWCRDIRAEALSRAIAGRSIPGYKIIEGKRGNRRWIDGSVAAAILLAEGVDPYAAPEVINPTEAQRRIKAAGKDYAEVVGAIVDQPPGKPSLAKWSDEGKPLAQQEFGIEEAT